MRLKRKQPVVSEEARELEKRVDSMMSLQPEKVSEPIPDSYSPKPKTAPKVKNFNAMEGFSTKAPSAVKSDLKIIPSLPIVSEDTSELKPSIDTYEQPKPEAIEPPATVIEDPDAEDPEIDQAIEDIVISESNELLAAQDASIDAEIKPKKDKSKKGPFIKRLFKNKWLYFGLGLLLILIFAVPYSRYMILGHFLKNQYEITVTDSTTNTPVSGASVKINGTTETTNGQGHVSFNLNLGKYSYEITKHYYQQGTGSLFVGLDKSKPLTIDLKATGRQVPIEVINKLTDKPLADVSISVLNTNTKTNSNGQAFIVLPTSSDDYLATVSDNGYNTVTTRLVVSTNVNANSISLVPTGSVYFLTDTSSIINVVKANLDGSDPQIVLAGTGSEQANTTTLMTSPDEKYLVLEAQRSGSQPELYIVNANTGQPTEFDSSADKFTLIGWSGDEFIYDEVNTGEPTSTSGREQIKSYNAETQQLNILDQSQVNGDTTNYDYQSFYNFELLSNVIIYNTQWNIGGTYDLTPASDTIRGVEPNGLNKKDYYTFPAISTGSISVAHYQPSSLYFSTFNTTNNQTTYYSYSNGAVTTDSSLSPANFSQSYPTYYFSPSGEQTLWTQTNNGQITVLEGDQNGQSPKTIGVPTGYSAYGWYDNVYILLDKAGQLYISPATGSTKPLLIGNYLVPSS